MTSDNATARFMLTLVAALALTSPAAAADLGGDCCADLEERIAELEATATRKGNRKVSLTVAGQINQAVLFWDDGYESNAYVVGNKNDQSNFSFTGDAKISPTLSAGYAITVRLRDTLSDDVDQNNDDGSGPRFQLWESNVYLESKTLGKVTLGQASRVTDTAPENDLSETAVAAYAGVQDIGGAFALRNSDGSVASVVWGDLHNHFNGDTANVIRYDTPEFHGFVASASWGEDDIWDAGLRYEGGAGGFKIVSTIAYTQSTDETGLDGDGGEIDNSTIVGSIAVLHEPSGLNALIAAGQREFDQAVTDADGNDRTPEDAKFIYAKLGWIAKLNGLGPTALYGEYGRFEDFLTVVDDIGIVQSLNPAGVRIAGSESEVWGVGIVQHIEAAEMQIYLGYRNYSAEFDVLDVGGNRAATDTEDFDTVIAGSKISF